MFKFLKDKLKNTISKISSDIDKEGEEEVVEETEAVIEEEEEKKEEEEVQEEKKEETKEEEEKKSIFKKILPFGKKKEETEPEEEKKEKKGDKKEGVKEEEIEKHKEEEKETEPKIKEKEKKEEPKETKIETAAEEKYKKDPEEKEELAEKEAKKEIKEVPKEENKGIFSKIKKAVVTKKINEKQFDELFWDLELALLENNVAVEVIDKIRDDLKESLIDRSIARSQIEKHIIDSLKSSINDILSGEQINILENVKKKKPYVMCFVGINGSGKTTTIAKMAYLLKMKGLTCCLAAADTFRAAAIDQLAIHAERLGIKIIKHDYGADPAAVAFDAIKHAEAKNIDVVLIDTAGRIHSDVNLQDEMKKIIRIAKPDLKIFVGESITGNDCVEQAKRFNESIDLDGIILSKADIDEKGGSALSISYVTKKPIAYLGTGQEYGDLAKFDKEKIMANLGL
ncbi:MAG: signal recognition particle-docking protein FtsY [Nanoarchaeota archaeon]|nr:signal recognition particle-docking protein FtsY [Nanoarchaeota archaeon]